MTETGNLGGAQRGGPLGGGTNQSGYVAPNGTLPRANVNGPLQTTSIDQAVDRYIKQYLVTRPFLGISVTVHRLVRQELDAVERDLDYGTNQQQHGVTSMRGYQGPNHWLHSVGCAIDFNYETLPYLMREAGEGALDTALVEVYDRIASFLLGRASVIPQEITINAYDKTRREFLFRSLKQESDAMTKYFGLFMKEPDTFLVPYLASSDGQYRAKTTSWLNTPPASVPNSTNALRQIQQDWVTLTGRNTGPQILLRGESGSIYRNPCDVGMCYPAATEYRPEPGSDRPPDAPFVGRDPAKGFLTFDFEVVSALMDHGFTWGAIGFGAGGPKVGGSGDVMHFELTTIGKKVLDDAKRVVSL